MQRVSKDSGRAERTEDTEDMEAEGGKKITQQDRDKKVSVEGTWEKNIQVRETNRTKMNQEEEFISQFNRSRSCGSVQITKLISISNTDDLRKHKKEISGRKSFQTNLILCENVTAQ